MDDALKVFASRLSHPAFSSGGSVGLSSLTGSADAFLALSLAAVSPPRVVVAVTEGLPAADRLFDDLTLLASSRDIAPSAYQVRIAEFPPLVQGDKSSLGTRSKTLAALKAWSLNPYPLVIAAPFVSLARPVASSTLPSFRLVEGVSKFSEVVSKIAALGYDRIGMVEKEGDWSQRGGIVDIWSPGDEFPVRCEFFGEDLESIRTFNAATQRSLERIQSAEIISAKEDSDFEEELSYLTDFLPPDSAALALDHNAYDAERFIKNVFLRVYTGEPLPRGTALADFQTVPLPGFGELDIAEAHHPELFDAARMRLERHLKSAGKAGERIVSLDALSGGFEIPPSDGFAGLVVVTKADRVFTKRKARVKKASAPQGARLSDFDDLEPGEYVVHLEYGVGRFVGSSEILMDGNRTEVFTIEYDEGAKLHVNASQAHLLSRYVGVRGQEVRLHRLDGKRWNKDKLDAQKAVADLAAALLRTQAERETAPGFAYDINCEGREAFDAAFPYEETNDQLAAIKAIEEDLSSTKPMDRLICGDAGYGKTEVAMRAAYIAALNGKQTAVLAPTTVLAEQHFETFTSRFDGTPVRIESVSRFQSGKIHQGTFERLKTGACDIVIGTHAILSPKIRFRDLGLIIIDEEQRFGVRHKEFLKRLRATADVLTLSATPIPRTLYMSMTGARDLSLLSSPPRERVAVETVVVRDSDMIVRSAIEAELARGGQVFFLHNRVTTMGKVEKRLREICTKLRIVVAHGQMDSKTLARKMRAFERGEYDLLLSTTIIESGIDIPRANTILVSDAQTFGLADLYQLRGRVGRSAVQGRAIFLLPGVGSVDSDVRERLAALKRHGGLGGGFALAVRDLELRGAGNLLGSEQSGHIAAVGFTLYCQLLKRTVAMLKGEKPNDVVDVKLNLDFIVFSPSSEDSGAVAALPYDYIEEDSQRMGFMKRLAEAGDEGDVRSIKKELVDRYGRLPSAAARLIKLAELRVVAAKKGVGLIRTAGSRAFFYKSGSSDVALVEDLKSAAPDGKIRELFAIMRNAFATVDT